MILATHYAAGMALANQTDSLILLSSGALALHFLMDKIPHWEYLESIKEATKKFHLIFIDLFFCFFVSSVFFLYGNLDFKQFFWLNLGGFFCILPDGLGFLKLTVWPKNRFLRTFSKFHDKNHTLISSGFSKGFWSQVLIIILAFYLAFFI